MTVEPSCEPSAVAIGFSGSTSLDEEPASKMDVEMENFIPDGRVRSSKACSHDEDEGKDLKVNAVRHLRLWEAFLHIMKGNVGPGMLALPVHFAKVGTVPGMTVMAVVASQGVYGMRILVSVQQQVADTTNRQAQSLSFEDLGEEVFGTVGRRLVQACICSLQLGVCAVFISLLSTNLSTEIEGANHTVMVLLVYAICACLALLPDLGALWPLSLFGNCAMLTAVTSATIVSVLHLLNRSTPASDNLEPSRDSPSIGDCSALLAACFYAFEGVALVLPVRNALKPESQDSYTRVLVSAMIFVASLFLLMGGFGGAAFPNMDSASITAFLSEHYESGFSDYYFGIIDWLVSGAVLATFPLQLTPVVQVLDAALGIHSCCAKAVLRVIAVTLCAVAVLILPKLDILIDVIGSATNTALAAFPCALHAALILKAARSSGCRSIDLLSWTSLVVDLAVITLCFLVMVLGLKNALVPLFTKSDG